MDPYMMYILKLYKKQKVNIVVKSSKAVFDTSLLLL